MKVSSSFFGSTYNSPVPSETNHKSPRDTDDGYSLCCASSSSSLWIGFGSSQMVENVGVRSYIFHSSVWSEYIIKAQLTGLREIWMRLRSPSTYTADLESWEMDRWLCVMRDCTSSKDRGVRDLPDTFACVGYALNGKWGTESPLSCWESLYPSNLGLSSALFVGKLAMDECYRERNTHVIWWLLWSTWKQHCISTASISIDKFKKQDVKWYTDSSAT